MGTNAKKTILGICGIALIVCGYGIRIVQELMPNDNQLWTSSDGYYTVSHLYSLSIPQNIDDFLLSLFSHYSDLFHLNSIHQLSYCGFVFTVCFANGIFLSENGLQLYIYILLYLKGFKMFGVEYVK